MTTSNGDALTAIRDLAELQKRLGNRMSPDDVLTVFEALDATKAELQKREKQIDAIGDGIVELARSWIEAIDEKMEENGSLREQVDRWQGRVKLLEERLDAIREAADGKMGRRSSRLSSDLGDAKRLWRAWRDRGRRAEAKLVAMTERAEKAERERDEAIEQLRVATQMLDSQRDNVAELRTRVAALDDEVKRLRNPPAAELEETLEIPDWVAGGIERARGTSSRAPDARKGLYFDSVVVWLADDREKMLATTKRFISSERIMAARYHDAQATIATLREAMPSEDALNGAIASVVIVESVSRKTGNPMIEPARDWLTRLEAARKEVG